MDDSTSEFVSIIFADICRVGKFREAYGESAAYQKIQKLRQLFKGFR